MEIERNLTESLIKSFKEHDEYEEELPEINVDDLKEVDNIDTEITDYISSAPIKAIRSSFSGGDGKSMADIVAVAKFDSDEIAFFTKNYKVYVLDEMNNSVKEVDAAETVPIAINVQLKQKKRVKDLEYRPLFVLQINKNNAWMRRLWLG